MINDMKKYVIMTEKEFERVLIDADSDGYERGYDEGYEEGYKDGED